MYMAHRRSSARIGLLAVALAFARTAGAHDQTYPVAGDSILVRTDQGPGTEIFQFEANGPDVPMLDHDPRADGTAILVRGVGAAAGRTAMVALDRNLWSADGEGFVYDDPDGTRGGITHVEFGPGVFTIQAGAGFGWSPAGAQDEVWVHMRIGDTGVCSRFVSGDATSNAAGHFAAEDAAAVGVCPAQVCGDGLPQSPEACDDGNLASGDGCEVDCELGPCNAQTFTSTFEAIQTVVFEGGYGCNDGTCHDSVAPKNDLELTHDVAYEELLGADGTGVASHDYPDLKLVQPAEPEQSYLYIKLAAKTFPNLSFVVDPGTSMPSGGKVALSQEHLEAVWKWIRGGAPREGVVSGTQELLGTCLPPPTPLKIPPVPPPAPATGIQLRQPPWNLPPTTPTSQGEDEICMATYYDVSQIVPEWAKTPCPDDLQPVPACAGDLARTCTTDGDCAPGDTCTGWMRNANHAGYDCFVYDRTLLQQDPQSHHSIISLYTGGYLADDTASWGEWTRKLEPTDPDYAAHDGEPCDPWEVDPLLGTNPGCSTPVKSGVACGGFGPPDSQFSLTGQGGGTQRNIITSQEPYFDPAFAGGVYAVLPLSGVVLWNSHAFNLTSEPSTLAQYLNIEFAPEENQVYPVETIFWARWIFAQDTPAFGTEEVCGTFTIPQHARLFELSSHTHLRGTRWRTWGPPNTPCQPGCPTAVHPIPPQFGMFQLCGDDQTLPVCEGPREEDQPLYYSTDYTDPLQLRFDPPLAYDSPDEADRTFLYCSLYDNGSTDQSPPVKRRSTTPMPPGINALLTAEILNFFGAGGPCQPEITVCADGPSKGQPCVAAPNGTLNEADHALCGDPSLELCDACPIRGGVTTEDEMFILMGSYFIPEPDAVLLAGAALAALAWRARRKSK
jgi:cysteine-rich repeat protein